MNRRLSSSALAILLCCAASACGNSVSEARLRDEGMYWERADVSEASYQEGPKAQQMLHRDIARCVTELRELDRLGAVRNALPAETETNGGVPDPNTPPGELAQWDTPQHDAYLLAEQGNYDDFEGCMKEKGWVRMEHVPYDVAKVSRENYIKTMNEQKYQTKVGNPLPDPAPQAPQTNEPTRYGYAPSHD